MAASHTPNRGISAPGTNRGSFTTRERGEADINNLTPLYDDRNDSNAAEMRLMFPSPTGPTLGHREARDAAFAAGYPAPVRRDEDGKVVVGELREEVRDYDARAATVDQPLPEGWRRFNTRTMFAGFAYEPGDDFHRDALYYQRDLTSKKYREGTGSAAEASLAAQMLKEGAREAQIWREHQAERAPEGLLRPVPPTLSPLNDATQPDRAQDRGAEFVRRGIGPDMAPIATWA